MQSPRRRTVLRALLAIPVVGAVVEWFPAAAEAHTRPVDPLFAPKMVGVSILRLLNTAEHWYKAEYGRFADLPELLQSPVMAKVLSSQGAQKKGFGRTFFAQLDFRGERVHPNWRLAFRVSSDGGRYTFLLESLGHPDVPSVATDERGVIYRGGLKRNVADASAWLPATGVLAGHPIGHVPKPEPGKIRAFLQSIAAGLVAPVHADHCPEGGCCCGGNCCHDEPCDCLGHCQPAPPGGGGVSCTNCGCVCCVFCCDIT